MQGVENCAQYDPNFLKQCNRIPIEVYITEYMLRLVRRKIKDSKLLIWDIFSGEYNGGKKDKRRKEANEIKRKECIKNPYKNIYNLCS